MAAVGAALAAFAAGLADDRREFLAKRQAVIDGTPELKERDLLKAAALTAAMVDTLIKRGVESSTANLAAQVGALALGDAFQRWVQPGNRSSMAKLAEQALRQLGVAMEALR